MAQRSQMFYAYFRFYVTESDIIAGMEQYCTEWEHMYEVGYNYKEYKCFVDNVGGFEHWVGDMRGYISQTRETGFIDGSPSDNVYDAGLLMGQSKVTLWNPLFLHAHAPDMDVVIRKVIASKAGTGKIDVAFDGAAKSHNMLHSFYYTYDEQKIELYTYKAEMIDATDATDVTYTMDLGKLFIPITYDSTSGWTGGTNAYDNTKTTSAQTNATGIHTHWLIYDLGSSMDINNIVCRYFFGIGSGVSATFKLYGSDDKVGWTLIESIPVHAEYDYTPFRILGVKYRYLKYEVSQTAGASNTAVRLHEVYIG